jgi:hypothetical protein
MLPALAGLIVQLTALWLVFATLAVNCCVWPFVSTALGGVTLTDTGGINVTMAVMVVEEIPSVVAVIVTLLCALMLSGAV